MATDEKRVPLIDHDSMPFWESCRAHAMALQRCRKCGRFRYPPRLTCPHCSSEAADWVAVRGVGKVYVALTVHKPPSPAWTQDVPYNVSIIELEDGVRMWSNVIDCSPDQVSVGDQVELVYYDVTDELSLPRFRRVASDTR